MSRNQRKAGTVVETMSRYAEGSRGPAIWPTSDRCAGRGWAPARLSILPILLLASSPAFACNEGDGLTDYMADWLLSSDETRAAIVIEYDSDIKKGGFQIEGLKTKYLSFFGKRPKPIGELKKCTDDGIISALDAAIKRTNYSESAN